MLSVSPGVRLELGWGGSLRAMNERSCKYCIVFPPERDMDDPRVPKAVSTPPHDAVNTTSVPCAEARMTLLLTWLWPFYPFKRFLRLVVCLLSSRHNPWCWEHSINAGLYLLLCHRQSSKQKARNVGLVLLQQYRVCRYRMKEIYLSLALPSLARINGETTQL